MDDDTQEFSDEELEALAGDELPDEGARSTNGDPPELAGLGITELGAGSEPQQS